VQPPVSCACPWLEGAGRASDYRVHAFQARAFRWQRPGSFHDGRVCLYGRMQLVDTKCSGSSLVPYPDYLRHVAVQQRSAGSAGASAASADNTIGFCEALLPAFDSAQPMASGSIAASAGAALGRLPKQSELFDSDLVSGTTAAFLNLLAVAAALPGHHDQPRDKQQGGHDAPVMYLGVTGASKGAQRLALTHYLWPYYKVPASLEVTLHAQLSAYAMFLCCTVRVLKCVHIRHSNPLAMPQDTPALCHAAPSSRRHTGECASGRHRGIRTAPCRGAARVVRGARPLPVAPRCRDAALRWLRGAQALNSGSRGLGYDPSAQLRLQWLTGLVWQPLCLRMAVQAVGARHARGQQAAHAAQLADCAALVHWQIWRRDDIVRETAVALVPLTWLVLETGCSDHPDAGQECACHMQVLWDMCRILARNDWLYLRQGASVLPFSPVPQRTGRLQHPDGLHHPSVPMAHAWLGRAVQSAGPWLWSGFKVCCIASQSQLSPIITTHRCWRFQQCSA
jgi:hypothetical protein